MNFGVIKLESLSDRAALLARVCLAVVVQYRRVTDAQTDGRTHDDSIYRASMSSSGNERIICQLLLIVCRSLIHVIWSTSNLYLECFNVFVELEDQRGNFCTF